MVVENGFRKNDVLDLFDVDDVVPSSPYRIANNVIAV
jgi:hypothetical protein